MVTKYFKVLLLSAVSFFLLNTSNGIIICNTVVAANISAVKVKSITWSFKQDTLYTGELLKSKVSVKYASSNSKKSPVKFSSSNSKVAYIDKMGNIKAVKEGMVNLTASCGEKSIIKRVVVLPKGTISVNSSSDVKNALLNSFKRYKNKSFSLNFKLQNLSIDINNILYQIEDTNADILYGRNIQMMSKIYTIGNKNLTLISLSSKLLNSSDEINLNRDIISTDNAVKDNGLNNNETATNKAKKETALNNKIKETIQAIIKPGMTQLQKELAIHDYVVNNTRYDSENYKTGELPDDDYTAYGILINKTGVCQGYAEAVKKLLDYVGIKNIIVTGTASNGSGIESHAWNIVQIDGEYYHLDTTWDDPVMNDGSNVLRHDYFNVTDKEIDQNHSWDTANYPECTSTKASFDNNFNEKDNYGNYYIKVKSYNQFYDAIKDSLDKNIKIISMKIYNYNDNTYDISNVINKIAESENTIISGCSWTYYNGSLHKENRYITLIVK